MIALDEIRKARLRIRDSIRMTPCAHSEVFSQMLGGSLCLKLENLQRTGSFKERGALNKILTLTPEERARGVIAASAGNHAQAVAYHSAKQGITSTICMPMHTPLNKVMSTREYGAEVVLFGQNYDEAYEEARRRSEAQCLTFLHPFDDDAVIAGQGTIGLELLDQIEELDTVVVAIGGGGLASGVACAIKQIHPKIRVIGVETERLPSMKVALEAGKPVTLAPATTMADGIAVRRAGERTLELIRKYVDDIVTVGEEEIANAVLLFLEREKMLAEGAGAAAIAAVINRKITPRAKSIAVVVSGGNIDVTLLSRIIERGLVKDGRLIRLRVNLPDYPGALYRLSGLIAEHRANIIATSHDRAYYGVNLGETAIDFTLETRGESHAAELIAALDAAGYVHERIQ
ncbi:MAG TPA: threonine ammonia-lyase [Candidatus Aquilonibacter sp.]|nr:threonine ammonia-lyase [Candidatus Aquilonibacter sp.]